MSRARNAGVSPPVPHGGRLVERLVPADRAETLASEAARLPAVRLDGRGLADLECLAVGAFSPLTHIIVGRDHAGVGSYYGTYAAQEAFDAYQDGELGIEPLRFEHAFFCRRCDAMATSRTCPHRPDSRLHLSGTAVRAMLERGELPPPELSRPEVARVLVDGYRAASKG